MEIGRKAGLWFMSFRSLNFRRLKGIVAQELGIQDYDDDGRAIAPVVEEGDSNARADVIMVEDLIHKGIRAMVTSHNWKWLTQPLIVNLRPDGDGPDNVEKDAARYLLPHWYAGVYEAGGWKVLDTNEFHLRNIPISSYDEVARMRVDSAVSSDPMVCGIRKAQREEKSIARKATRWEAIFYPKPSRVLKLEMMVTATPYEMSHDDDEFVAGPMFDECLERFCLYEAALADRNSDTLEMHGRERALALTKAIAIDKRSGPRIRRIRPDRDGPSCHSVGSITVHGQTLPIIS